MIRTLETISETTGRLVAWLTLAMVLVTFGIVLARYGFNAGSVAVQESVTYMHAIVFLLGAGYTLKLDQHVRVDIFYHRFPPRRQAWVNLLGVLLLLLPTCGFILWTSLDYVVASWTANDGHGEASREAGGLPWVYLLKTLIPLFCVSLILQGVALALSSLRRLREG
ncbi:MAG: TRAP transporter small permease subunit [Xanthomonadales bacterium]|nr:TRAP transporter small permease subunit [Xanthomonadales bacterium]